MKFKNLFLVLLLAFIFGESLCMEDPGDKPGESKVTETNEDIVSNIKKIYFQRRGRSLKELCLEYILTTKSKLQECKLTEELNEEIEKIKCDLKQIEKLKCIEWDLDDLTLIYQFLKSDRLEIMLAVGVIDDIEILRLKMLNEIEQLKRLNYILNDYTCYPFLKPNTTFPNLILLKLTLNNTKEDDAINFDLNGEKIYHLAQYHCSNVLKLIYLLKPNLFFENTDFKHAFNLNNQTNLFELILLKNVDCPEIIKFCMDSTEFKNFNVFNSDIVLYALSCMRNCKSIEYADYLIKKLNIDLNKLCIFEKVNPMTRKFSDKTPVMLAIIFNNPIALKYLLDNEANLLAENNEQKNALDYLEVGNPRNWGFEIKMLICDILKNYIQNNAALAIDKEKVLSRIDLIINKCIQGMQKLEKALEERKHYHLL